MPKEYAVVRFPEEDDKVELVPASWLIAGGEFCLWPPESCVSIQDAIRACKGPGAGWALCPVVKMKESYGYRRGLKKLKLALDTSDLDTHGPAQSEASDHEVDKENTSAPTESMLFNTSVGANSDEIVPPPKRRTILPPPPKKTNVAARVFGVSGFCQNNGETEEILIDHDLPCSSPPSTNTQNVRVPVAPTPRISVASTSRDQGRGMILCGSNANGARATATAAQTTGAENSTSLNGFQEKCIRLLLENRLLLRELTKRVASLENNASLVPAEHQLSCDAALLIEQPLSSIEELEDVERALREPTNRLAILGGGDFKEIVKLALDRTMKNTLQAQYSVEGRRGKRSFKTLSLCSVIVAAVLQRMDALKIPVTEADFHGRIGKYLAGACDRDGGRKRRMKEI
ncbi:uncharacterized protein LOC135372316 isoform X2 [Ornithodoros turicata]|uniref:uncharacterized protein LOC135372316 isoform X2 n=1 Tax=Ornithodoros turicata TaxID=34597 RepID=UPI003139A15D